MVDSVKNYGIAGVAANVQLGKGGAIIVGSNSSQVAFEDVNGELVSIEVAEGTEAQHAVTLNQLGTVSGDKVSFVQVTANFDDSNVSFGTASANTKILSITINPGDQWTGANSETLLTVGDDGDVDRFYSVDDVSTLDTQLREEVGYTFASSTEIKAFVTQGSASAGSAIIILQYVGTITS